MALRSRRLAPDSNPRSTAPAGSPAASTAVSTTAQSPLPSPPPGTLTLVGHEPLFSRGTNAALAISGDRAFVGSRTDGSDGHEHPGILVVDISRADAPLVVAELGPPGGIPGDSTRELRRRDGRPIDPAGGMASGTRATSIVHMLSTAG